MNANELRLGNIVTINNIFSHEKMLNTPLLVCGIEKLRENEGGIIKLNYPNYNDNIVIPAFSQFDKFINPIPLTEEWFLKAGFYKHIKFKNTYVKGSFSIKITDSGVIYFKYNDFVIAELLFIHQLQNIFFSLCGEELVFSTTD